MEPSRITANDLLRRMDQGESPVVIDARSPDAWSKATSQAAGSIRVAPDEVAQHLGEIPKGRPIVVYCT